MRVGLLTTYQQRCGLATYAESLADELRPLGMDVHVLAPRLGPGDEPTGDGATRSAVEPQPRPGNRGAGRCALAGAGALRRRPRERQRPAVLPAIPRHVVRAAPRTPDPGRDDAPRALGRRPSAACLRTRRFARVLRWSDVVVHNRAHADELRAAGHRRVHVTPPRHAADRRSLSPRRATRRWDRDRRSRARALRLSDAGQGRPGGDARGRRPASVGVSRSPVLGSPVRSSHRPSPASTSTSSCANERGCGWRTSST